MPEAVIHPQTLTDSVLKLDVTFLITYMYDNIYCHYKATIYEKDATKRVITLTNVRYKIQTIDDWL